MLFKIQFNKQLFFTTLILIGISTTQSAQAHLMVAQHGTLNLVKQNLFMVLSLPVSAFNDIDDDNDAALSPKEFTTHRAAIINRIHEGVLLTENGQPVQIQAIMVSPSAPDHNFSAPTEQIIVMGRFELSEITNLNYSISLFGKSEEEQTIKITTTVKADNTTHTFELSPDQPGQPLFDTQPTDIMKIIKTGMKNISLF